MTHIQPILIGKYIIADLLGSGSFASVYLGYDPEGTQVAIKLLKDKVRPLAFLQELKIMTTYGNHQHLVALIERLQSGTLQSPRGLATSPLLPPSSFGIVMEYVGKDTLLTYVNREGAFSELQARIIFKNIISGLEHLHNCGIVHRDLKAENILIRPDMTPVICDMGFATFWSNTKKLTRSCGSLHYASPEIVNGQPYIGPEIDVWSIGVVLYAIIAGSLPWNGQSEELIEAIELGDYWRWVWFSPELIMLLDYMLQPNVEERWSISQIKKSHWYLGVESASVSPSREATSIFPFRSEASTATSEQNSQNQQPSSESVLKTQYEPSSDTLMSEQEKDHQVVDSASLTKISKPDLPTVITSSPSPPSTAVTTTATTTPPTSLTTQKRPTPPVFTPKVEFIPLDQFKQLNESERGLFVSGRRSGKSLLSSRQTLLSPHILKSPRFTRGSDLAEEQAAERKKSPLQNEGVPENGQTLAQKDPLIPHHIPLSPRVKELLTPREQTLAELTLSGNRRSLSGLDVHLTQLRFKDEKQSNQPRSKESDQEREEKERNELEKKKKRWSLGISDLRELEERAGSLFGTKNDPVSTNQANNPAPTATNAAANAQHHKNWKNKLHYLKSKIGGSTKPKKESPPSNK